MNTDRCSKEHYHATRARPHKRGLAHAQIYNPGQDWSIKSSIQMSYFTSCRHYQLTQRRVVSSAAFSTVPNLGLYIVTLCTCFSRNFMYYLHWTLKVSLTLEIIVLALQCCVKRALSSYPALYQYLSLLLLSWFSCWKSLDPKMIKFVAPFLQQPFPSLASVVPPRPRNANNEALTQWLPLWRQRQANVSATLGLPIVILNSGKQGL